MNTTCCKHVSQGCGVIKNQYVIPIPNFQFGNTSALLSVRAADGIPT